VIVIITPFAVNFQMELLVQLPSILSFLHCVSLHIQRANPLRGSVMRKKEVRKA